MNRGVQFREATDFRGPQALSSWAEVAARRPQSKNLLLHFHGFGLNTVPCLTAVALYRMETSVVSEWANIPAAILSKSMKSVLIHAAGGFLNTGRVPVPIRLSLKLSGGLAVW